MTIEQNEKNRMSFLPIFAVFCAFRFRDIVTIFEIYYHQGVNINDRQKKRRVFK